MALKPTLKCVDLSINISIIVTSISLCLNFDYRWVGLLIIPIINHFFLSQTNIVKQQPIHDDYRSSQSSTSSSTSTSSEYGDLAYVNDASLLSTYLKQRRKKKKQLFEYEDISLTDDTDKIISMLRRISNDIDVALNSIGKSLDCSDKETISSKPKTKSPVTTTTIAMNDINDRKSKKSIKMFKKKRISFDPNWRSLLCSKQQNNAIWGSFMQCSSSTVKLRGANYLTNKMKISSKESLLSLAYIDMFRSEEPIHHITQHKASWFYKNRSKLPQSLFFIIIHLRMNSVESSVVQYFYVDRNKYKHLLKSAKCKKMLRHKGNGYFAINGRQYDESGMFWNFINGSCKYRNDRLKLIARKEEGPFYLYIPSKPVIIGKKVPIRYYRCYEQKYLNSTKVHKTRSQKYKSYKFKTLYCDERKINSQRRDVPCDCGRCEWIDNDGQYAEYLELEMNPEVNMTAHSSIKIAAGLAKSLQVEMHWTLEGQRNNIELPERMLCSARFKYMDLSKSQRI